MTGNDGKMAGQSSGAASADHWRVRLRPGKWSVAAAAAVLVLAARFFVWEVSLYGQAEEPELTSAGFAWYGVGYWTLSLLTAFVCLLEVHLPVWPARVVSWVLLLALPLGAFAAVDLINSTRILTFSF